MNRASLIKSFIRVGIRFVPNELPAYRFFSGGGHFLGRTPKDFQVDATTIGDMPALWVNHKTECSSRVILYLHGGGYAIGSTRTHLELAARIARAAKSQMLMVDYRLAPEHPYPAGLNDALKAYQYLLSERISPDKIVIAGDSAGGGLAIALLQTLRNKQMPMPAAAVCLSPWLDLSCSISSLAKTLKNDPLISPKRIRFFAKHYAGSNDRTQPGMSPFFGELDNLPPMLIQVGGDEILLPECTLFTKRANKLGSMVELQVWPGMFHVWQFAASILPEGRQAIQKIGSFIRKASPV